MSKFIPLNKLLLEDNKKVKKIQTIYQREEEYSDILGPMEVTIACFYKENEKLKDKNVIKAIKNIKLNYDKALEYFKEPLEKEIIISLSEALQKKKITVHEFLLVLSYILWCIDNRKWMGEPRAYLNWLLKFFDMFDEKEKEKFDRQLDILGEMLDIDKTKLEAMKCNFENVEDLELDPGAEKWNIKNSKKFVKKLKRPKK